MKIYTGTGDRGKTSLFSGERVIKSDDRIEAYGDVDELNSAIGTLMAVLPEEQAELLMELQQIQSELFQMGAWLATVPGSPVAEQLQAVTLTPAIKLEAAIDRMEAFLTPLKTFILPGGHLSAALAHVARTVCRRTERHVIRLLHAEEIQGDRVMEQIENVIVYLNRLSDYLFVASRHCNAAMGMPDNYWKK
jgi:cob(I)alamin adenosyltransferase